MATNTDLVLRCLCYIAASLAPVSSLTLFFMPLVVRIKAFALCLVSLFHIYCLSSGACRLALLVADWFRVGISKKISTRSASYLRKLKRCLLYAVQVC